MKRTLPLSLLLCPILLLFSLLLPTVYGEVYVGRYEGAVTWTYDPNTGRLEVYGDCGDEIPAWQAMASDIRSVYIAPGVTRLSRESFRDCILLEEITLPETLKLIDEYAFAGCSALRRITLPQDLTYVRDYAFDGCERLNAIVYTGSSEHWESLTFYLARTQGNQTLTRLSPTYTQPTYRLHISYMDEQSGKSLCDSVIKTLTQDADASILSPEVEGYVTDRPVVRVSNITEHTSVTVYYHRTSSALTIRYLDTDGTALLPSQTMSVSYAATMTLQAPAIEGYECQAPQAQLSPIFSAQYEHTFVYTPKTFCIRIHCTDEQGTALSTPLVINNVLYGQGYSAVLPHVVGYSAPMDTVLGEHVTEDIDRTVIYTPLYYPVTVHMQDSEGNVLAEDVTFTVRHGDSLRYDAPLIDGYVSSEQSLAWESITAAEQATILYERSRYLLTVRYEADDGTLLQQTGEYLLYGQPYACTALTFEGYAADKEQIDPLTGNMPSTPLTVTVRYREQVAPATPADPSNSTVAPPNQSNVFLWVSILGGVLAAAVMLFLILRRYTRKTNASP